MKKRAHPALCRRDVCNPTSFSRLLFWALVLGLLILNLIPIGNSGSNSLSSNQLFRFRLDYLAHSFTFLAYAWLWIWGKIRGYKWFKHFELPLYIAVVLLSAFVFEYAQVLVSWRTFNPKDLYYNLIGASLAIAFILISHFADSKRP
ncbi:MAG: VanZ family protein [Candidatus Cloacimonetes bacterium]|nr:VanZ family protein [Candidatus Cloacimonadota bacterium]MDY0171997.1 VanZ family protein [Candidatus Cloacimonadaceae bacterium]